MAALSDHLRSYAIIILPVLDERRPVSRNWLFRKQLHSGGARHGTGAVVEAQKLRRASDSRQGWMEEQEGRRRRIRELVVPRNRNSKRAIPIGWDEQKYAFIKVMAP